jgi:hypothetical protein
LHNDLDAYALAYSIASLLNNLFGKGKEPFWQQAYTNLVKFIILLHKIAYDYVTLFDVYESAISPDVLERKIQDAERRLEERLFLLASAQDYRAHFSDLSLFDFTLDESLEMYRANDTPGARRFLQEKAIAFEALSEAGFDKIDPDRQEQLDAVKRWFYVRRRRNPEYRRIPCLRQTRPSGGLCSPHSHQSPSGPPEFSSAPEYRRPYGCEDTRWTRAPKR